MNEAQIKGASDFQSSSLLDGVSHDDTAKYSLFWFSNEPVANTPLTTKPRAKLDQLRKCALQLSDDWLKDYIWQRDAFNLEAVSRNGLLYLRGQTSYGDCIEDEWLIVYMLRHVTKTFPGAWARISDNDGEFLLIEGAKAVPTWLTPDNDANRVWIHNGMLKVIPSEAIEAAGIPFAGTRAALTLADATRIIKEQPESLLHLPSLEKVAFGRLEKYPGYITDAIHYARLVLPRKIAYILHSRPQAVASAVEAFSSRDPIKTRRIVDLAHSKTLLQFSPDDLVVISVRFTRTLYAQLRGQRFTPPETWPVLFANHVAAHCLSGTNKIAGEKKRGVDTRELVIELSMKLTFGFEILALSAEKSNSRVVREVGLILQDLAEDGDDPAVLPSDDEIRSWPNANRESDDSWLDINFEDFERELQGNPQSQSRPRTTQTISTEAVRQPNSGFGDANVQTDLRRIVSQFQSFLNDTDAGIDGADFDAMDEDDGSDDDVNEDTEDDSQDSEDETDGVTFDEAKFSRLLRDTLGLSTSDAATDEARAKSTGKDAEAAGILYSPDQDDENELDDKEDEILELAAQFEAELRDHGALSLSSPKHAGKLGLSSPKSTEAGGEVEDAASTYDQESDDEGELDVDYNLAKNLLESFKAQEGMSGPAGNILAMLGLALPRDEDEEGKGK